MAMVFILLTILFGNGYAENLKNVMIISIDALHPDALRKSDFSTLQKLMEAGAFTLDGQSTDPPKTLIAHAAMFTGLPPAENGKTDNSWEPGKAVVEKPTIFNNAKSHGFRTGYFYSKQNLGYLVNGAIDVHRWSRDNAVALAEAYIAKNRCSSSSERKIS